MPIISCAVPQHDGHDDRPQQTLVSGTVGYQKRAAPLGTLHTEVACVYVVVLTAGTSTGKPTTSKAGWTITLVCESAAMQQSWCSGL